MQAWIIPLFLSQFLFSFGTLIDKFFLDKEIKNPYVYLAFAGLANILFILLVPFVGLNKLSVYGFLMVLTSSLSTYAAFLFFYKAVRDEEVSRVSILIQISPIFVLILSYAFMGERLNLTDYSGFIILLTAGLLVSFKKQKGKLIFGKSLNYALMYSVFIAIAYVSAKEFLATTDFWNAVVWFRITGLVALFVLVSRKIFNEFKSVFCRLTANSKLLLGSKLTLDFTAFALSDYAVMIGPVALVSSFSAASAPVIVFLLTLLSTLFFPKFVKESITVQSLIYKSVSIVLIVIGITILEFH